MKSNDWIGIDFGTCYSCAARNTAAGVALIPCDSAPNLETCLTPTVAYITNEENPRILTGYEAESYRLHDPTRFFAEFKLDIVDADPLLPNCPFVYQDIVAAILADIRQDAIKDNNGGNINQAVITVPVVYIRNGPQWRIMLDAARKAGFRQVELLYEPHAAALYYDRVASGDNAKGLSLVYDLGGGTFDPALIERHVNGESGNGYRVLGSGENASGGVVCGGIHFDQKLLKHFLSLHPDAFNSAAGDPLKQTFLQFEVLDFCRKIKHYLSSQQKVIQPAPPNGKQQFKIERGKFESMIAPLVEQTFTACSDLMNTHGKLWAELKRVILIGGSCHIPLIRKKLRNFLNSVGASNTKIVWTTLEGQRRIDPIYAVCCGAAISRGKTMNARIYEDKRNELIDLLGKVTAIDAIPANTRERIQAIRTKCVTDQFEVVLIGEFQGGKSTTFNAICDGREISPRGAMIKTSACKISAENLVDPKAEEYAKIKWRGDQELLLGMINLLYPHLRKAQPERFLEATPEKMIFGSQGNLVQKLGIEGVTDFNCSIAPISLRDEADRKLIDEALQAEWASLKKNKKDYAAGQLDVLRISSIIFHFINNEEIATLTSKSKVSIHDLEKLVIFPRDWESRWMGYSPQKFAPEEIAFAFIGSIRCHIHSQNLARLGCVITDCPGLFSSRWDTHVARQAMFDADAILYLFGGDKTLSQGDIHALNEIRQARMDHKLFYAINVKGNLTNIKKLIRVENASMLSNRGFEIVPEDMRLYHALLGLCAKNGKGMLENRLDERSQKRFVQTSRQIDERFSEEFQENWRQMVNMSISNMDYLAQGIQDLDHDSLQRVIKFSGLDDLLAAIEETVIAKKARSILVNQGADKARFALEEIEGDLKSQEKAAQKTEAEFHLFVIRARDELESFQKDIRAQIGKIKDESIAVPLAENFENEVILANIPLIAKTSTTGVVKNLLTFDAMAKRMWGIIKEKFTDQKSQDLKEMLKPIFEDALTQICGHATEGWVQNLREGNSRLYNVTIGARVEEVCRYLKDAWQSVVDLKKIDKYAGLLDGLAIEAPVGTIASNEELFNSFNTESLKRGIRSGDRTLLAGGVLGGLAAGIIFIITGIIAELLAILAFSTLGFITPAAIIYIPPLIIAAIAGVSVIDNMKSRHAQKLKTEIEEGLRKGFGEPEAREKMRESSMELVSSFQDIFVTYFEESLKAQEKEFNSRVKRAKRNFEQSEAERKKLAERLHRIRTTQIEPVRKQIQKYLADLEPLFQDEVCE